MRKESSLKVNTRESPNYDKISRYQYSFIKNKFVLILQILEYFHVSGLTFLDVAVTDELHRESSCLHELAVWMWGRGEQ